MKQFNAIFILLFAILMAFAPVVSVASQKNKHKIAYKKERKKRYVAGVSNPRKQCTTLNRKRFVIKKSNPKHKSDGVSLLALLGAEPLMSKAEIAANTAQQPAPVVPETEEVVITEVQLPPTTSDRHESIRKMVQEQLQKSSATEPIPLEPLFFVTGKDEFAFVEMEPFLVAVEYALQGKTLLIAGHTDDVGDENNNVSLSMQRVERIRNLMADMGVPDDRISVIGYGEEMADEKENVARQNDRRVDFTVF